MRYEVYPVLSVNYESIGLTLVLVVKAGHFFRRDERELFE